MLGKTLLDFIRNSFSDPKSFRYEVVRGLWMIVKSFGARGVHKIAIDQLGVNGILVHGTVKSFDSIVVAALCQVLKSKTFFEIGTYLGETTWLVAHNNPSTKVWTLDLPCSGSERDVILELTDHHLFQKWDRGSAFVGTPESDRIIQLHGDSAALDFSPYQKSMDMVFIDGSHSYSYVKSDTEAAFRMLSPSGTIVWHDYPAYPGVYVYLNELGLLSDRPIMHIGGTGLAIHSRHASLFSDG
jgi:hypothetical protein